MKKIVIKAALLGIAIASLCACDSYDFSGEQYEKKVYLYSDLNHMYDRQVASLKASGDTIYLVAGLSGTTPSSKAYDVVLVESDSLFNAYNKSNFDIDESRFAHLLPEQCYSIPSLESKILAGKNQVRYPIYLSNLDQLSPDSIYLLDYKLDLSKMELYNDDKKEVLLRIYKENEFATTKTNTFYSYTSSYVITSDLASSSIRRPTNTNQVFPLGENSVRMLAGDETIDEYKTALNRINAKSIKVIIGDQTPQNPSARSVLIQAYRTIDVAQMAPQGVYNNTYLINVISTPDGRKTYYKEFRLHYKYRLVDSDPYTEVKAILRLEYSPRLDEL